MSTTRARLRIVFAGTPDFAATALAALHAAGFTIPLVLTQPDRPAGRHLKLTASPVKHFALEHGLTVLQPLSLRSASSSVPSETVDSTEYVLDQLRACKCDVMVVAAYGLLLPQSVLDIPRYGCINLHASLLPRWRGAAPIQRAIEAGDTQSGITLMQMEAGLDTGPMISKTPVPIHPNDNATALHDTLASCAAQQIVLALHALERDARLASTVQPTEGISYAAKIGPQDAFLDWDRPAKALADQIRAFDPYPGCKTVLEGKGTVLKVVEAFVASTEDLFLASSSYLQASSEKTRISETHTLSEHASKKLAGESAKQSAVLPGTLLQVSPEGVWIACGAGVLCITVCQKPGGKKLPIRQFLTGFSLSVGQRFILPT